MPDDDPEFFGSDAHVAMQTTVLRMGPLLRGRAGFCTAGRLAVISLLALSASAQAADDVDLKHLKATNSCFRCDLSEAELREANLSGADLREANLFGAELFAADLSGADLTDIYLIDADLSGADLTNADLRFANLNGANLRGANLTGADLTKATLSQADLSKADLSEAFLLKARLFHTNLTGTNLAKTDWDNAFCRDPAVNQNFLCTLEELKAAGALVALTDPPHGFSGTALFNFDIAPFGTPVTATIGSTEVATATVTTDGAYKFRIHQPPGQSYVGKEITFKVGGFAAAATSTWEAGKEDFLNL
ncbi:MAG: pentapeptide repeat-containing protein, partial [Proteobacteria bacterium]|nr:pentapeptide repeat-containing protein [Pseudomonadota bacterium]